MAGGGGGGRAVAAGKPRRAAGGGGERAVSPEAAMALAVAPRPCKDQQVETWPGFLNIWAWGEGE